MAKAPPCRLTTRGSRPAASFGRYRITRTSGAPGGPGTYRSSRCTAARIVSVSSSPGNGSISSSAITLLPLVLGGQHLPMFGCAVEVGFDPLGDPPTVVDRRRHDAG